jgi:hypothetical protein
MSLHKASRGEHLWLVEVEVGIMIAHAPSTAFMYNNLAGFEPAHGEK